MPQIIWCNESGIEFNAWLCLELAIDFGQQVSYEPHERLHNLLRTSWVRDKVLNRLNAFPGHYNCKRPHMESRCVARTTDDINNATKAKSSMKNNSFVVKRRKIGAVAQNWIMDDEYAKGNGLKFDGKLIALDAWVELYEQDKQGWEIQFCFVVLRRWLLVNSMSREIKFPSPRASSNFYDTKSFIGFCFNRSFKSNFTFNMKQMKFPSVTLAARVTLIITHSCLSWPK